MIPAGDYPWYSLIFYAHDSTQSSSVSLIPSLWVYMHVYSLLPLFGIDLELV